MGVRGTASGCGVRVSASSCSFVAAYVGLLCRFGGSLVRDLGWKWPASYRTRSTIFPLVAAPSRRGLHWGSYILALEGPEC